MSRWVGGMYRGKSDALFTTTACSSLKRAGVTAFVLHQTALWSLGFAVLAWVKLIFFIISACSCSICVRLCVLAGAVHSYYDVAAQHECVVVVLAWFVLNTMLLIEACR